MLGKAENKQEKASLQQQKSADRIDVAKEVPQKTYVTKPSSNPQ